MKLIVIVGPTAVGKTAMAIKVANYFNTEIISADSRQFFREISIGTAKPSAEELASVKHHFIDSHSINDDFSAGHFESEALNKLAELFKIHNVVVAVGGSGLYINALCDGLDNLPSVSDDLRAEVINKYETVGISYLQEEVKRLDPEYFSEVDINNPQRLMRALEVCLSSGKPFSSFRTRDKKIRPFEIIKIGLNMPREELYQRINLRVDVMIEDGLLEEVKQVYSNRDCYALKTVGYTEIFDYLDGKHSLDKAIELIKQNTRRFAKRQITWFGRDKDISWFLPNDLEGVINKINNK